MNIEKLDKVNRWNNTILILSLSLFLFFLIFYPAYLSYKDYNDGIKVNEENFKQLNVGGIFYSNGTIRVFNNSTITLRHELIHRWFWENNYTTNQYLEEVVCYTAQWFIWNKVNLTTLDWGKI